MTSIDSGSLEQYRSDDETIRKALAGYELGSKLRQLRLKKKISLVDLGRQTGLSASMLSQLENSKLIPTLPTLVRIAMVFDVGVEYFFGGRRQEKPLTLVRKADRAHFPDHPEACTPNYLFESLSFPNFERPVRIYMAEIMRAPEEGLRRHSHEGAEFFYVMEGIVAIQYGDENHVLNEGDSVSFDSSTPHSYQAASRTPAKAIVVTTAPHI